MGGDIDQLYMHSQLAPAFKIRFEIVLGRNNVSAEV